MQDKDNILLESLYGKIVTKESTDGEKPLSSYSREELLEFLGKKADDEETKKLTTSELREMASEKNSKYKE
jgi:hypothetical protein